MKKTVIVSSTLFLCSNAFAASTEYDNCSDFLKEILNQASIVNNDHILGYFTENNISIPIRDVTGTYRESDKVLVLYLTPSVLSEDQKNQIRKTDDYFIFLSSKDYRISKKRNNYPYIHLAISFNDEKIEKDSVRKFEMNLYNIDKEQNFSYLSVTPYKQENIEFISYNADEVKIKFSGYKELDESKYRWCVSS